MLLGSFIARGQMYPRYKCALGAHYWKHVQALISANFQGELVRHIYSHLLHPLAEPLTVSHCFFFTPGFILLQYWLLVLAKQCICLSQGKVPHWKGFSRDCQYAVKGNIFDLTQCKIMKMNYNSQQRHKIHAHKKKKITVVSFRNNLEQHHDLVYLNDVC